MKLYEIKWKMKLNEIIWETNIITLLLNPLSSNNETNPQAPNPIILSEYLYSSRSAFSINLTAPSK